MDYNKMMKFIENPITRNIMVSNRNGHLELHKQAYLEEKKKVEKLVQNPNDFISFHMKKTKDELRFDRIFGDFMSKENDLVKQFKVVVGKYDDFQDKKKKRIYDYKRSKCRRVRFDYSDDDY